MGKIMTKKEKQLLAGGIALGVGAGMLGSSYGDEIAGLAGLGVGVSMLNRATKPVRKKKY